MTTTVTPPTVGRVVWFWRDRDQQQPFAASVAYVFTERMVNLGYMDAHGVHLNATSVPLIQDGDASPTAYFCEWMPYQKGQAAKTEVAEATALELGAAARALGKGSY